MKYLPSFTTRICRSRYTTAMSLTTERKAAKDTLSELWSSVGLPVESLSRVDLVGEDPLPSSYLVGHAAQVSFAAEPQTPLRPVIRLVKVRTRLSESFRC